MLFIIIKTAKTNKGQREDKTNAFTYFRQIFCDYLFNDKKSWQIALLFSPLFTYLVFFAKSSRYIGRSKFPLFENMDSMKIEISDIGTVQPISFESLASPHPVLLTDSRGLLNL